MKLEQLKYFREICRTKSFVQAAKRLYLTQNTLTYQIQQLENELGFKLFERDSRHVEMTPQAAVLITTVDRVIDQWEEGLQQVRRTLGVSPFSLRVGMLEMMDPERIGRVLDTFRTKHPDTVVIPAYQVPLVPEGYIADLIAGKRDVIYIISDEIHDITGILEFIPLARSYYGLCFNWKHPLSHQEAVAFADIDGENLILPEGLKAPENRTHYHQVAEMVKRYCPNTKFLWVPDFRSVQTALDMNEGVALYSYSSTAEIDSCKYALKRLMYEEIDNYFGIAFLKDADSELVRDFVGINRAVFTEGSDEDGMVYGRRRS